MEIIELKTRGDLTADAKTEKSYTQFQAFLDELRKKELPDETIVAINKNIEALNAAPVSDHSFKKQLLQKQRQITGLLEKEHKIVPKNYYRNLWLALGMAVFGIPIGVALGAGAGNMGLLAIGLPIGMVIGIAVGTGMDKKALEEGRQLNIELKDGNC